MSAFTEFMVGQGGGVSVKQLTDMINAFNSLSSTLSAHMTKAIGASETVEDDGTVSYSIEGDAHGFAAVMRILTDRMANFSSTLNGVSSSLTALVDTTYNKMYVDGELAKKADSTDLASYVTTSDLDSSLNDYAKPADITSALEDYTKTSDLDAQFKEITDLYELVKESNVIKGISFKDYFIQADKILGLMALHDYVDFTKYALVSASRFGTYTIDGKTNDILILGMLSEDFSDQPSPGITNPEPKPATVYIKYVDTAKINIVIHASVTRTGGAWTGSISHTTSRTDAKTLEGFSWHNLSYHIVHGTTANGKEHAYLAISADKFSSTMKFYVAGINFIPNGELPQPMASSDQIICTVNTSHIQIGDGTEDDIRFSSRPWMPSDSGGYDPLISSGDLEIAEVPVGGIVEWPIYNTLTKKAVKTAGLESEYLRHYDRSLWEELEDDAVVSHFAAGVPKGYFACNGGEYDTNKYKELYAVLGSDRLPVRDYAIIHATLWNVDSLKNDKLPSEMTKEELIELIKQEVLDREAGDSTLSNKIKEKYDELSASITAEALTRSEQDAIEVAERAEADRELKALIAQEATNRAASDASIAATMSSEAINRASEDAKIRSEMQNMGASLGKQITDEAQTRSLADKALYDKIVAEEQMRSTSDKQLHDKIDNNDTKTQLALSNLKQATEELVGKESDARAKDISALNDALTARIDDEAKTRSLADKELSERIDAEAANREATGNALAARLDAEAARIDAEASTREASDNELSERVDEETTAREASDNELSERIDAEEAAREQAFESEKRARISADNKLSARIDALEAEPEPEPEPEPDDDDEDEGDGEDTGDGDDEDDTDGGDDEEEEKEAGGDGDSGETGGGSGD